jgi:hypothetical protein
MNTNKKYFFLPEFLWHKMMSYARASKGELGGFARIKIIGKKDISVVNVLDVKIYKQIITDAHCTLSTDVMTQAYMEAIQEDGRPQDWKLWWHSHNDFGVFFSKEDNDTIADITRDKGDGTGPGHLFSICINKFGHAVGREDYNGEKVQDMEIKIEQQISKSLIKICEMEVKRKVTYEPTTIVDPTILCPVSLLSDKEGSSLPGPFEVLR